MTIINQFLRKINLMVTSHLCKMASSRTNFNGENRKKRGGGGREKRGKGALWSFHYACQRQKWKGKMLGSKIPQVKGPKPSSFFFRFFPFFILFLFFLLEVGGWPHLWKLTNVDHCADIGGNNRSTYFSFLNLVVFWGLGLLMYTPRMHLNLCNITLHNVTPSHTSQNSNKQMCSM